jgi:hypothetical protein
MQEAQFVEKPISPQKTRIAVAAFFFVSGFDFPLGQAEYQLYSNNYS